MKRLIIILAAVMMLNACQTTRTVTVVEHHTDTLRITKQERDSIWLHDSVHVIERQRGDTIYIYNDRVRVKYVERVTHDTLYQSKTDSIPVPYPVTVQVKAPLTWWQQTKMRCGIFFMLLVAGLIIYYAGRLYARLTNPL